MTDSVFSAMLFALDWKCDSVSDIFTHRFLYAKQDSRSLVPDVGILLLDVGVILPVQ
jgi:hypothetical protein